MIALEMNRRVLIWLCVYPADQDTRKWMKFVYILFKLLISFFNVMAIVVSIYTFSRYKNTDLETSSFTLVHLSAELNAAYITIITFRLRHKFTAILNDLNTIYERHANDDSIKYLLHVNELSDRMWLIFLKFIIGSFIFDMSLAGLSALVSWQLTGELVSKYLFHPFDAVVLPWNQLTWIGYLSEAAYAFLVGEMYLLASSFTLLFVSVCQHTEAFNQMFRHYIRSFDNFNAKTRDNKELLVQLIRFHITIKEFFKKSSDVFSVFILVQLFTAMFILSGCIFFLDMQVKHPNFPMALYVLIILIEISLLFLYCYFGKIATENFQQLADCLFESNWQNMPIEIQKYYIIMIGNAQQPLYFHGFNLITLNLSTFNKLLRTVYSYYMMFKTVQI